MENSINNKLLSKLKQIGIILPKTEEEIKQFEKYFEKIEIPDFIEDNIQPFDLIEKGKPKIGMHNFNIVTDKIKNEFAWAARNGENDTPSDILEKMRIDKESSKK